MKLTSPEHVGGLQLIAGVGRTMWQLETADRGPSMPRSTLTQDECNRVLGGEGLVRIAFRDQDTVYLIPLGYVWLGSALYGVADAGRKTEIASRNPQVAFQVDTSTHTGLWEWQSVTGEGRFDLVDGPEKGKALAALQPVVASAPDWWRREQGPKMAAGTLVVWRLFPTHVTGCRYAPAPPADE
jgi:nitroimidazol reductase NimA-like FMN-containing flavoprotein (pyridoxamine 5'-phosphate oxidase superfamily)